VEVFRDVKRLFDPDWLLNPGKVLSTDPESATRHLRPESKPPESSEPVALQLTWTPAEMAAATDRCNGCGVCRTQSAETRMCPLFRLDPSEEAAPRSKANLMRRFASGRLSAADVATPEFKRIADLCFNCKQCERECPSNVSIPHLMIEAKAQYVATHGLTRAQWLLSRANLLGSVGNTLSAAMNAMLGSPFARLVLERLTGISRQRKLPRFARRSFLRLAKHDVTSRPRRAAGAPPAIYFVDHYANSHDPQLARAFIEVLRHNRIPVHVPPRQQPSGMAFVSLGDIEAARDVAETNLSLLADFARDGSPIVCTEPAAAVCLKMEYPRITSHPDADVVAERVIDASSYLLELFNSGRLKEPPYPVDLHVGYHQPCHVRTFSEQPPAVRLLSLIRGLRIHKIEKGCSGMAGTFGLCQETFSSSVRIGWELISRMRSPDLQVGVTECSSCKMQMEQGTTTPTVHPIKLLALAYGLMPELQSCLKPNRHRLLVT
jgi:Fe-S oxidoreductase